MMDPNIYPAGWDRQRVEALIRIEDAKTDDELAAEYESDTLPDEGNAIIEVPIELLPAIRQMLALHRKEHAEVATSS